MDVTLKIQNREALLVWTIPYVTSHYPSMDMVIDYLALEPMGLVEGEFPTAFTASQNGEISELPASQWIDIQIRMNRLDEASENYTHEQWRFDSIEIIRTLEPIYVWLDEFQVWFDWHVKSERLFPEDQKIALCFSPMLPQIHAAYFEQTFLKSAVDKVAIPQKSEQVADGVSQSEGLSDEWQNNQNLTKLDKQHRAILEVIRLKGFAPMQIPDGEKGTLRTLCEADYPLLFDGSTSFDNAWKVGRHLFAMANHASFAGVEKA
jgi:hypothetical protein